MQVNRIQHKHINNTPFQGRINYRSEKYFYDMVRMETSTQKQQQWMQLLEELKLKAKHMHENTEIDISGYENKQIIATNNNVHISCNAAEIKSPIRIGNIEDLKKAVDSIDPRDTDYRILEYAKHKLRSLIRINDLFPDHPNGFAIKDLKNGIKTYETDLEK